MATFKRPTDIYDLLRRMRRTDLTVTERAVLLTQYSYADKDGTSSRPSEETLASDLASSVRTIRRARKSLTKKGWLVEVERGRNKGESTAASAFEVVIPTHQEPVEPKPKRKPSNPLGRNQWDKPTGQICPTSQQDNLTKNPSSQQDTDGHLPSYLRQVDGNQSKHGPVEQNPELQGGGTASPPHVSGTEMAESQDEKNSGVVEHVGSPSMVGPEGARSFLDSTPKQQSDRCTCKRFPPHDYDCPKSPYKVAN